MKNIIKDEQNFLFYLKFHGINFKDYDYIEGKTTDKEINKNHLITKYRRWYTNPILWYNIFSKKDLLDGQDYIINNFSDKIDNRIISAIFVGADFEIKKEHLEIILKVYESKKDSDKPIDYEDIISYSLNKKSELFKKLIKYFGDEFKNNNKKIGDINNGYLYLNTCINGYEEILDIILRDGYDTSKEDSMGFIMAIKHANYKIAYSLLNNGANIDTKNRLAYKMFLRNENKRICHPGEEWYHNELLKLFKENNKQKVKE